MKNDIINYVEFTYIKGVLTSEAWLKMKPYAEVSNLIKIYANWLKNKLFSLCFGCLVLGCGNW